jgi:hypothetical protein
MIIPYHIVVSGCYLLFGASVGRRNLKAVSFCHWYDPASISSCREKRHERERKTEAFRFFFFFFLSVLAQLAREREIKCDCYK